jgi:hypothetical protein
MLDLRSNISTSFDGPALIEAAAASLVDYIMGTARKLIHWLKNGRLTLSN